MNNQIPVVLLAGGRGTRMRNSKKVPKPMARVGGVPLLIHIMWQYARYGFEQFVVCLGYKGKVIREHFENWTDEAVKFDLSPGAERRSDEDFACSVSVRLIDTGENTKTAGRIQRVSRYLLGSERFCVAYGDCLANVDFDDQLEFHKRHGLLGTVTSYHPQSPYGHLTFDEETDTIANFLEKPVLRELWASTGFFMFEHPFINELREDDEMLEARALPMLVQSRQVAGYRHEGYVRSVDNQSDLDLVNEEWTAAKNQGIPAPWESAFLGTVRAEL